MSNINDVDDDISGSSTGGEHHEDKVEEIGKGEKDTASITGG